MRSTEIHRKIKRNGWRLIRAEGGHYIYEKNLRAYPVPYHGAREIGKDLVKKMIREMNLVV
jgi:predicted RNA binding protein YcfA (HicA-like mRNA interferase family)